jgi:sugar O-acyltransferase (sialic acid O-acetyltransferase NeuD family)
MQDKTDKLIIIGDSAFAEIAYEYFTYDSQYEVAAFSVDKEYLKRDTLFNIPVVPFEDLEKSYPPSEYKIFTALTYAKMNRVRRRFYLKAKEKGYSFATYISSNAFVWRNVLIGENTFIFENNVVQPFVKIGNNCVLWSGNHIGHHSTIKDNNFIASHVVISGFCEIQENCFIGVNTTIANNVVVKKDCLLGAAAVILKDTEEAKTYGSKMTIPKDVDTLTFFGVEESER